MMKLYVLTVSIALGEEKRIIGVFDDPVRAANAQAYSMKHQPSREDWLYKTTQVELNTPADWGDA